MTYTVYHSPPICRYSRFLSLLLVRCPKSCPHPQLPLPEDTERSVSVIVVLLDGARCPAKCSLRLPKAGRVGDLIQVGLSTG